MDPSDRLSLFWVWASFSAASWTTPTAGPQPTSLPAPRLSLSPPYSVFVQGEKVQLTCSPPGRRRAEEFLFYKLNPRNQWDRLMRQKEDTWEVSITHQEQEITFICTYAKRNRAGELLQSAPSNLSVVSIIELPPAPSLSLDPEFPVYLQGERVTLICSAPEGQRVSGYLFEKEQPGQTLWELPHAGQGPYRAFEVDPNAAGKYSCTYWMLFSGREIRSPHSGLVSVAMTERPRPPLFSVSPEQEVYSSGEVLSLRCLTPGGLQVSEVTFLKDSQRLHLTRLPASPGNFTHAFPISPQDGGKYSCKYLAVKSGREIPSLASNVLRIAVMAIPVTEPWPATLNVHTYETVAGVTNSPGVPASLAPDQLAARENSGATEAHGPATPVPRSSQLIPHDSNSSSTESRGSTKPVDSQEPTKPVDSWVSTNLVDSWVSTKPVDSRGSTKPVDSWVSTNLVDSWISTKLFDSSISRKTSIDSSDLGSTSQTRTVSGAEDRNGVLSTGGNLNFPLVVGCSAAGILFLVLLLVCLTRRKLKGNRKRASRSFWENLDDHHFRKLSRIYHPNRTHLDLQEIAKPQEADQDQVILPKPADVSSSCGDPSIQSQADDNADFGAEFKFPVSPDPGGAFYPAPKVVNKRRRNPERVGPQQGTVPSSPATKTAIYLFICLFVYTHFDFYTATPRGLVAVHELTLLSFQEISRPRLEAGNQCGGVQPSSPPTWSSVFLSLPGHRPHLHPSGLPMLHVLASKKQLACQGLPLI